MYRRNAVFYNLVDRPLRRVREQAIAKLSLRRGDAVLDLGCGTGLSFPIIERCVGPAGSLTGIDVSPHMLLRARRRVARAGWTNLTLIEASAEEIDLPESSFDAVLCFYTHDIMQSQRALQRAVAALHPGGCIVAAGVKETRRPGSFLLNALTKAYSGQAVRSLAGFGRPWARLEEAIGAVEVEERLLGTGYIARGVKA